MIRLTAILCVLATPLAAQSAIGDRPGRWLAVPRAEAPAEAPLILEAPEITTPVIEAPAPGPLITEALPPSVLEAPSRGPVLTAPESTALLTPPRPAPSTRPVPRPRQLVAEAPVSDLVDTLAEAIAAASQDEDVPSNAALAAVAPADEPQIGLRDVAAPLDLLQPDATAALAEALAAALAEGAREIMTSAPRAIPVIDEIAPEAALLPLRQEVSIQGAVQEPVQRAAQEIAEVTVPASLVLEAITEVHTAEADLARPTANPPQTTIGASTPPAAVPMLPASLAANVSEVLATPSSIIQLPARARGARPVVQPTAFITPRSDMAPIVPNSRPAGPAAQDVVLRLDPPHAVRLAAVLVPGQTSPHAQIPRLIRAPAPVFDPFPLSALPPSALPEGPESQSHTTQPDLPFAEANAAVLMGAPPLVPARLPGLTLPQLPVADALIENPDAPAELPAPDPDALARMIDDALVCWRLADLPAEAQWARLSVAVALDDMNTPSAQSIRFTGFAGVVSGAAEEAFRAARAALMGCGGASEAEPFTVTATLIFDRNGVRVR